MTQTQCELCAAASNTSTYEVPLLGTSFENKATLCAACRQQIASPETLEPKHWHCLNESMWSENPAVKVLAWRILSQLSSERFAQDLLDQLYLEDDVLAWAKAGNAERSQATDGDSAAETRDSNGTVLAEGDAVTLIKDLEVKGANFTAKRGTLVKNIVLTGDPALVEGRVNGTTIVLKTCFLKKATA